MWKKYDISILRNINSFDIPMKWLQLKKKYNALVKYKCWVKKNNSQTKINTNTILITIQFLQLFSLIFSSPPPPPSPSSLLYIYIYSIFCSPNPNLISYSLVHYYNSSLSFKKIIITQKSLKTFMLKHPNKLYSGVNEYLIDLYFTDYIEVLAHNFSFKIVCQWNYTRFQNFLSNQKNTQM